MQLFFDKKNLFHSTLMETKQNIINALKRLTAKDNLRQNAVALFEAMGYNTSLKGDELSFSAAEFIEKFEATLLLNEERAFTQHWSQIHILFLLTSKEISGQKDIFSTARLENQIIESYFFFAIDLAPKDGDKIYSRTDLANITREVNKCFNTPVMVLFRVGDRLSLAVINRRLHKSDEAKDVLEKVTLIKDINPHNPNRGHLEILFDLSIDELKRVHKFDSFVTLHRALIKTLDTSELNNRFYKELSKWFDWATDTIKFNSNDNVKVHTIKIISRLLFLWFLKEKGLISEELFDKNFIDEQLNDGLEPDSNSYYVGVLSNLFFNTVNEKIENRFKKYDVVSTHYFKDFEIIKRELNLSPFVNGGLFDPSNADFCKTIQEANTIKIPNKFFFGENEHIDLSKHYEDKERERNKDVTVKGLIDIFNDYIFTVEENTPVEIEVALDPELLGKIFERLLASYNEESRKSARKETGSYYTPREIVDYMVDQSLIAYLETAVFTNQLPTYEIPKHDNFGKKAAVQQSDLFGKKETVQLNLANAFEETQNLFPIINTDETNINQEELAFFKAELQKALHFGTDYVRDNTFHLTYTDRVLDALDTLKILDPAVGSGAFPMGILQKITLLLIRLDPKNRRWLARMLARIPNAQIRKITAQKWENENTQYLRKLGIVESTIHGIDIQATAVQISKLRFFISLVIEQDINTDASQNYGIQPLPNLDFKFICANTLIDAPVPPALPARFAGIMETFVDNVSLYFNAASEEKKEIKKEIISNIDDFISINDTYIQQLINKIKSELPSAKKSKINKLREELAQLLNASDLWHSYKNIFDDKPILFFKTEYLYPSVSQQGGFDIVIGNPPYVLVNDEKSVNELESILKNELYTPAKGGKNNLFKLFLCKSIDLLKKNGLLSEIFQNSFLGDSSAKELRRFFLETQTILSIDSFPERDNKNKRVFEGVKMSVCILISKKQKQKFYSYKLNVWEEKIMINRKQTILNNVLTLNFDPVNFSIFGMCEIEKSLLVKLSNFPKLSQIGNCYEGEINLTFHKNFLRKPDFLFARMIKGAAVQRYELKNKMSQGEEMYIDKQEYLSINKSKKSSHFNQRRIVMQGITGVDEKTRLKMTIIEPEIFCGNSVNYILMNDNDENNLNYILSLLNSKLLNWFFKFFNTNSNVNGYEVNNFPIPKISPEAQNPFINLVEWILEGKKRGEDTSRWEAEIDRMVYELYDLTEAEIAVVEGR